MLLIIHGISGACRTITCALFFICAPLLNAQQFNGYVYSDFAGILGARTQPASIAGSPYNYHFSLVNASFSGSNNISQLVVSPEGGSEFQRIIENDRKFLQASLTAGGLSAMFTLPNKQAIGIQAQFRSHLSTNNISPDFANQFQNWQDPQIINRPFSDQTGEFAGAAWRELSFTYAKVFKQQGRHMWKGGITAKMINSYGSLFIELEDFDYTLIGQGRAEVTSGSVRYGFSDNLDQYTNFGGDQSFSSLPPTNKAQFAVDLGVVYQHKANRRPLRTKNGTRKRREFEYDYRIGFSITDIGVLKFNYGGFSTAASELLSNNVDPVNLNVVFARPSSLPDLTAQLQEFLVTESLTGEYTIALPAASHINVDYNLGKGFFANANIRVDISSLLPADYKLHYYSNVTLTPRWESRSFGLYMPLLINQLGEFRGGAAVRLGPLVFGSQDWGALFSNTVRQASFFFTLNLADFALTADQKRARSCFSPWG